MARWRRGSTVSRRLIVGLLVIAVAGPLLVASAGPKPRAGTDVRPGDDRRPEAVSFEPNVGQAEPSVAFVARGPDYGVALGPAEAKFRVDDSVVSLGFVGADPTARAVGHDRLAGRVNYLVGDSSRWRTDVATYGRVRFE